MENHEEREFYMHVNAINKSIPRQKIIKPEAQLLKFRYDKWCKGSSVVLNVAHGQIEASEIDIIIPHHDLIKLLEFLLDVNKENLKNHIQTLFDKCETISQFKSEVFELIDKSK